MHKMYNVFIYYVYRDIQLKIVYEFMTFKGYITMLKMGAVNFSRLAIRQN